jgi:5-methylcytosine-specific restriction endonuclease McrA
MREAQLQHASRRLHVYSDDDGTVLVKGRLSPEAGALLLRALEAARETLYPRTAADAAEDVSAETPTFPQQQADALTLLAETALHHGIDPGTPGERYQVVAHVDAGVLANAEHPGQSILEDGARVSAETSQRLACDASRVAMREDGDGRVVEIGARTRTIPPALRRALQRRDRGCCFPGCGVRVAEGHHIHHWARGGKTILSNLALLCRRHHRAVHEEGFGLERDANGALTFRRPTGWTIPDVPELPAVPVDPMEVLRDVNIAQGLDIDGDTMTPNWHGERLDVPYAIDVLHPRALASRPDGLAHDRGRDVPEVRTQHGFDAEARSRRRPDRRLICPSPKYHPTQSHRQITNRTIS